MTKALAALAAAGLALAVAPAAPAQAVSYDPVTGQPYVSHYVPYTYGSPAYHYNPYSPYMFGGSSGPPPTVYGPGFTTNTPWQYMSYRNGGYVGNYWPRTYYRTYRWQP
jgi:hypothetical protein